ncbi:hypothetical protein SLEP1_g35202 [Rubroshorea leprosula]|uniref:Uncharacterized protein n=1 Tax=Rubroshorea leprosula TaxID=152421 RepID=A0AAV5KMG8_9ROSI|nr:hypothetical protein SLEP1_g35202 [Rubroshorea leprosula]
MHLNLMKLIIKATESGGCFSPDILNFLEPFLQRSFLSNTAIFNGK